VSDLQETVEEFRKNATDPEIADEFDRLADKLEETVKEDISGSTLGDMEISADALTDVIELRKWAEKLRN